MSKVLACSHIFVISKDMEIVDLGEYSHNRLHILNGNGRHAATLEIDFPSTKTKYILSTFNKQIPITDIFSCSNENSDCIILGTIGFRHVMDNSTLIEIEPCQLPPPKGRGHVL